MKKYEIDIHIDAEAKVSVMASSEEAAIRKVTQKVQTINGGYTEFDGLAAFTLGNREIHVKI